MKWNNYLLSFVFLLVVYRVFPQESPRIKTPETPRWNYCNEGQTTQFRLSVEGITNNANIRFAIVQGKQVGMSFDSTGNFSWQPPFSFVDRIENERLIQLIIEGIADNQKVVSQSIDLVVRHQNQPPIINELKPFYIKYNTTNTYRIDELLVNDPDNDPIVILPSKEDIPEGMEINSRGEISWSPSYTQFKQLKNEPIYVHFLVEDQPSKSQTKGKIKLVATQLDLPPTLITVPEISHLKVKEHETINIRFYLSDPNGDDDIETFDLLTNQKNLPPNLLIKNTTNQYEFTWNPGYDFIQDPFDSLSFYIDFFVLDKTQLRDVKRIYFSIQNAINEAETDRKNYELYKGTLLRAWELMEQLKEKEEELKEAYNKAKKGKRNRSVINASLGATTGLSSIFTKEKPDVQRLISTLGGTTVLTIGTLEATEVIGRSTKDLIERLNYVIEKKNDIQTKGDVFSRDFSLKINRRSSDFIRKVDDFMAAMNLKGLVALELNASWEPKTKATEKVIKKTFKDFNDN